MSRLSKPILILLLKKAFLIQYIKISVWKYFKNFIFIYFNVKCQDRSEKIYFHSEVMSFPFSLFLLYFRSNFFNTSKYQRCTQCYTNLKFISYFFIQNFQKAFDFVRNIKTWTSKYTPLDIKLNKFGKNENTMWGEKCWRRLHLNLFNRVCDLDSSRCLLS